MNRLNSVLGLALLACAMLSCDTGEVPQDPPPNLDGLLLDVAGTRGISGNEGDGGPALECSLNRPGDVTCTPTGDLLVVDRYNDRIRRIDSEGIIHSFIGSGLRGDGTSGAGANVDLYLPSEVEIAPDGNYYVSAYYNWRVKMFDLFNLECSVVAGTGVRGFTGDSGLAIQARLGYTTSTEFSANGDMFILDMGNTRVRKVDRSTGIISTFVGGRRGDADGIGEAAQFAFPGWDIVGFSERTAMKASPTTSEIYLADTENHKIRRIDIATRMVTSVAGTGESGWDGDGGPALSAMLYFPTDIAIASTGDIYIADKFNNVIRKIDGSGIITTVAGNGSMGVSPSGTRAVDAMLNRPEGIAFDDATNTLYIADTYNHQIRKVINP